MTPVSSDSSLVARRAIAGGGLLIVGALALAALIYVSNSQAPAAEQAMMRIGLAGSALISAVAQAMILAGGWLVWRAARAPR